MRVAFYAPMKPPDDPKPSGDRQMAQMLLRALESAGHDGFVAAALKRRNANGDQNTQQEIKAAAEIEKKRLLEHYAANPTARPDLWLSYHAYYKAPDWIGPEIAQAIDIPYVIFEASYAPKRADGPWADGLEAVGEAIRQAALILSPNRNNDECVAAICGGGDKIAPFPPFLDIAPYQALPQDRLNIRNALRGQCGVGHNTPVIVTAAMMREGDKRASYNVLARAMERLSDTPCALAIAGDGPARNEIEADFARNDPGRVCFLGQMGEEELPALLAGGDLFAWPAINEAYGMALLEAQAAGLPAVAGNSGGVSGIIRDGKTGSLAPPGDIDAFAGAMRSLLSDKNLAAEIGSAAQETVFAEHSLEAAAKRLDSLLRPLLRSNAA